MNFFEYASIIHGIQEFIKNLRDNENHEKMPYPIISLIRTVCWNVKNPIVLIKG